MTDEKRMVTLCGVPQKIHIRTLDEENPVLLFLHGGPGVCNRHAILSAHADLMDTFTLVTWDQRGSGGSYFHVPKQSLTVEQLTDDTAALIEWLCARFSKDKVFVIGGSWGSALGIRTVRRYPAHIAAFVGFGQMVNGAKNESISWQFTLEEAEKAGDRKARRALYRVGPPEMGCYKGGLSGMMVQRRVLMKYGGYSRDHGKRSYFDAFVRPMVLSGEYSLRDLYGLLRGNRRVLSAMWPEIGRLDFERDCTSFDVPIYIFDGRLDRNTPSELVQSWFERIESPDKHLEWFEHSAHNPMSDEDDRFKELLRRKLMAVKEREACKI